jgi:hypothetical protein
MLAWVVCGVAAQKSRGSSVLVDKKDLIPVIALGVLMLVISGCTAAGGNLPAEVEQPTSTVQIQATAVPTDPPIEVSPMPTEPSQPVATSTPEAMPSVTQAPLALPDQGPIPTGSSLLKATDPESVNLADGEPKFVEFFAFW